MRETSDTCWSALLVVVALTVAGCDEEQPASVRAPSQEAPPQGAVSPPERAETPEEDDRYSTVVSPEEIPIGESTEVALEITAGDGLKVNLEYPSWSIDVKEAEGIALDKKTFSREDFELTEASAETRARLRGEAPGKATLTGTANFSVCNDETCHIMRDEAVAFELRVTDSRDNDSNTKSE